jgi:hypothetical protein
MHHAADHVARRNGLGDGAIGVDRGQPAAGDFAAEAAFEKPPRHAVHRDQHDGVGSDQRPDAFGHGRQCGRLHGDDHQVLHTEGFRVGHCVDRHARAHVAAHQREVIALQHIERRTACHHIEPFAGLREAGTDPAADRAGAVNTNLHGRGRLDLFSFCSSGRCGRPAAPVH